MNTESNSKELPKLYAASPYEIGEPFYQSIAHAGKYVRFNATLLTLAIVALLSWLTGSFNLIVMVAVVGLVYLATSFKRIQACYVSRFSEKILGDFHTLPNQTYKFMLDEPVQNLHVAIISEIEPPSYNGIPRQTPYLNWTMNFSEDSCFDFTRLINYRVKEKNLFAIALVDGAWATVAIMKQDYWHNLRNTDPEDPEILKTIQKMIIEDMELARQAKTKDFNVQDLRNLTSGLSDNAEITVTGQGKVRSGRLTAKGVELSSDI